MDEKQFAGIRATWADRRELHDNQIDWLISAIEARDAIIYDLMIDHQKYVESEAPEAIPKPLTGNLPVRPPVNKLTAGPF